MTKIEICEFVGNIYRVCYNFARGFVKFKSGVLIFCFFENQTFLQNPDFVKEGILTKNEFCEFVGNIHKFCNNFARRIVKMMSEILNLKSTEIHFLGLKFI